MRRTSIRRHASPRARQRANLIPGYFDPRNLTAGRYFGERNLANEQATTGKAALAFPAKLVDARRAEETMDFEQRLRARQELEILLMDYWHEVDTNWGRNAHDYYTEDGIFQSTRASYHGRTKIKAFYQYRIDRGPRIAVHAVNNFRVELHSPTEATCTWYLLLYAMDGKPILPTNPPIQIAFMTDKCVKIDGRWLYKHRNFETWFEGGVPTTSPNLDDK